MNLLRLEPLAAGRWAMRMPFHPDFSNLAKKVPGLQWTPRQTAWIGYADAVELMTGHLEKAGIAKVVGPRPTPRETLSVTETLPGLRPYQSQGRHFILEHAEGGVILADGMGLGKTRQVLSAISQLETPAVIVCPANVKSSWRDEAKFLGLDATMLFGMSPPKDVQLTKDDGIVILNYELVDSWLPHLLKSKTCAFDEAQMLTNEKSKRSKACKELARLSTNRIALTGTPFQNRPKELWNLIDTISPGRFGKWMPFVKRYAGAFQEDVPVRGGEEGETQKVWNTKGASHTEELAARLKHFMLRRTKADVALEIPAKTRQLLEIDVSKSYKNPDNWWTLENKSAAQLALGIAAEGKIDAAVELAMNAIGEESNVVIFMHRKEVAKALQKRFAKEGIQAFMLTGDESPNRRQENAEAAKRQGSSICIATIEAVGTGVNYLSFADIAIFIELHYVPGKMLQAEDRLHRSGQMKPVTVYFLIALGTIDEMIRAAILSKLASFEDVIGNTGDTIRTDLLGMTDEEALDQLRKTIMEDYAGI